MDNAFKLGQLVWFKVGDTPRIGAIVAMEVYREQWSLSQDSMANFYVDMEDNVPVIMYTIQYTHDDYKTHTINLEARDLHLTPEKYDIIEIAMAQHLFASKRGGKSE